MSSINFNASATSALRTLQQTNTQLDTTQSRISSGLKIGQAKDNAAYWSISTTLKSDNKALSTVKDALGLGAATVDVAYESLNKAKDVLDEIKSKLTAATQPGIDKSKIQSEIVELQKQLTAIASSANFSGENWLSVDSGAAGYSDNKKVVSSYSRDANGAVTIATINIDTSSMKLLDRATGKEGILDGGKDGMTTAMTGGLNGVGQTTVSATSGSSVSTISAENASANQATADSYRVVYKVDGQTYTLDVAKATYTAYASRTAIDGTGVTAGEHAAFLQEVLSSNADFLTRASVSTTGAATTITSISKGTSSKAEIVSAAFVTSGTATAVGTQTTTANNAGANAKTTMATAFADGTNDLELDANDSLTFDVTIGTDTKRISINKNMIDNVLGTTDGVIDTTAKFKSVLTSALRGAGLTDVAVSDATNAIVFTAGTADISISNVTTSKGSDLTSFDITSMDSTQLSAMITSVNLATAKVVTAASTLGAVASRIELQKNFVNTLMDTIDKGVSGLVDADMNEESTKLQALQVKQQLGVQALSIANQSAQSVLSLFRS